MFPKNMVTVVALNYSGAGSFAHSAFVKNYAESEVRTAIAGIINRTWDLPFAAEEANVKHLSGSMSGSIWQVGRLEVQVTYSSFVDIK